jgi:DNA-binding response OmpR family regulator
MSTVPTILLIDDDPDFVDATCTVLESVPYKVLVAYSGSEGLAKAQETPPDLIILDVIMPVEDGFQVLERLRDDRALAHIPVMMLTSLLDGLSVAPTSGTDAAIADYVEKPVKPAELLRRIGELLEGQETQ